MLQRLYGRLTLSRQPLLHKQPNVELGDQNGGRREACAPLLQAALPGGAVHAELLRARWRDWLLGAMAASVALTLMGLVVMGMIDCFFGSPSQRGWVLLGLIYYIGATWKQAWEYLLVVMQRNLYVRVVASRMDSTLLFEAITARLESLVDAQVKDCGSRDTEAFTWYDTATGVRAVKFNFWGSRSRQFSFKLQPAPGTHPHASRSTIFTMD